VAVAQELLFQFPIVAGSVHQPAVFQPKCQWRRGQVAELFAKIIADHAIDDEGSIHARRRGERLAARKVAPFVRADDAARFEPLQLG
jgi:hypothetical protein